MENTSCSQVLAAENSACTQVQFSPDTQREIRMKVGDRVRVIKSVIVYHHPTNKGQPFDVKDLEGEVVGIIDNWQGKPVSANLPIYVQFDKKFKGHFRADELEAIA